MIRMITFYPNIFYSNTHAVIILLVTQQIVIVLPLIVTRLLLDFVSRALSSPA